MISTFFDTLTDAECGNPTSKRRTINKPIEINETFDLCDTWRIRNPKKRKYTCR